MSGQRKLWSAEEDQVLRELKEKGVKKWSVIARNMELHYGIIGRTGKQCRERWFNKLNPKIKSDEWNEKDTLKLFELHGKMGNSWVKMSQEQFKGRTDNSIKNHFYSVLRKGIRRLNKHLSSLNTFSSQFKQLNSSIVSKIVSVADDKVEKKQGLPVFIVQKAHQIKNKIVPFSQYQKKLWGTETQIINFYKQLLQFQSLCDSSQQAHINSQQQNNQQNQIKQQVVQQSPPLQIAAPQQNIFVTNRDIFKHSKEIKQPTYYQLSKLSSNSLFQPITSSGSNNQMFFLKQVSTFSGISCLFPPIPNNQWQKQGIKNINSALILSLNNIHSQNGEIPDKSESIMERLENK